MSNRMLGLVVVVACIPPAWGDGRARLPEPDRLSAAARSLVRTRMDRHEKVMSELVWAVVLLDYPLAERSANAIARGPRPLEPTMPELEALGPYFFEQQDLLKQRAAALAQAARARNGLEMGGAYRLVAETCVNCHVAYLNPAAKN